MSFETPFHSPSAKTPEVNPDQDLENMPDEAREVRVLKSHMAHARKTLRGERIFGDTIWEDLQSSLAMAKEGGVDVTALDTEVQEMIVQLPTAEVSNVLNKTKAFLETQDIASAKSWHSNALMRIRDWEQKGVLSADRAQSLHKEADVIGLRLYGDDLLEDESSEKGLIEKSDNVVDLVASRVNRFQSLSREEAASLEVEKGNLAESIKHSFQEFKERQRKQTEEAYRIQQKADLTLGTSKADNIKKSAQRMPWDSFEDHMLDMVNRAATPQDLRLIEMNFNESATNLTESLNAQEQAIEILKRKFG